MRDVIDLVRPGWVLIENVPGLLSDPSDPFGVVLSDLATLGFDAEWGVVSACAVGAPHTRERLFVVADTHGLGLAPAQSAIRPAPESGPVDRGWWADEPAVDRVAYGVPRRLDRVAALGDAVVPRVAELIGRRITAARETALAPS